MSDRVPRSVADEIGQRIPFRNPGQEAMVGILRTADVIRWSLGQEMSCEDLTLQQYNVLRILRGAGSAGLPTLEIAERMVERHPGVTRLLDRLEGKRLVARTRGSRDRRQVFCAITSEGLSTLGRLDGVVDGAAARVVAALGRDAVAELIEFLNVVRAEVPPGE